MWGITTLSSMYTTHLEGGQSADTSMHICLWMMYELVSARR